MADCTMGKFSLSKIVCIVVVFCVMAIGASAQTATLTTLHSFNKTDGWAPEAVLVQGTDGNLYGSTYLGANTVCGDGCGTIFKITTAGMLTTLHSFNKTDGANPKGGMVQGTDGNFYGTTVAGGAPNPVYGTVFKMTPAGMLMTLHTFHGADGAFPEADLLLAGGFLYGTTFQGASNSNARGGTVFKITTAGMLMTLHNFPSDPGGIDPVAGLIQGLDGNFYGTTYSGGGSHPADGTVFKMTPAGMLTTPPFHSFGGTDGANPEADLVQGLDGNFYGTTKGGGAGSRPGNGTIFKMTPAGVMTTPPWHSFANSDGSEPMSGLVQATDGNFYGTTFSVSNQGTGSIFKITPAGVLMTLHIFSLSRPNGRLPIGGLVQATDGNFYGTTSAGGKNGYGTVFKLSVGLGPFVETEPTSGRVKMGVIILGNNLTGASSVTFNGTAATFTVVSASEIRTTVPTGATTGKVKVTIPSRTLISNVNFRVS
jgi:uncharacterized repeat protein (TIGR03803 family)